MPRHTPKRRPGTEKAAFSHPLLSAGQPRSGPWPPICALRGWCGPLHSCPAAPGRPRLRRLGQPCGARPGAGQGTCCAAAFCGNCTPRTPACFPQAHSRNRSFRALYATRKPKQPRQRAAWPVGAAQLQGMKSCGAAVRAMHRSVSCAEKKWMPRRRCDRMENCTTCKN